MPERERVETAVQRLQRNIEAAKRIKAEIERIKLARQESDRRKRGDDRR